MENNISPNFEKWIKRCLRKEFESSIQRSLEEDDDYSEVAQRLIESKEMSVLLNSMRTTLVEQSASKSGSTLFSEYRPQSSLSCVSQASEDWNSPLNNDEYYNVIIDKISQDKPTHVRLAGYEVLLKNDLSTLTNSPAWNSLQKVLLDGLTDDSRPIFEASLQVHAKLLAHSQPHYVYKNLLNAFDAQYDSQKTCEILPTLIGGINFKFFLHERVFRIVHLMIRYHDEKLKSARNADKSTEELIEEFMIFLSTEEFGGTVQHKALNVLNIVSVLYPRADWSMKWMINLSTRRMLLNALGKSMSLLQRIVACVQKGLDEPPHSVTVSISNDPMEVIINGNTIETVTYLHCLCFVSQMCAYEASRSLLDEATFEKSFSICSFLVASLKALNKLYRETLNGVYDVSCSALQIILDKPTILYDSEFYHIALCHLPSVSESNIKIWPHTLNIILHMLNTTDGTLFLLSECKEHTVNFENRVSKCPAMFIIVIASNMLKQPFSIMNVAYLLKLFKVIEKLFDVFDVYEVVQYKVENEFYPAVSYFYNKLDKCYFENENKAQQINSAINSLLLKMVSIPFGLKAIVQERLVFEELIEGSLAPLRMTWNSMEVVSFVSSATFFRLGYNILANLAPHVLSTLLSKTCQVLEDPHHFYDPWDHEDIKNFLHILTFFSLNFKCFSALMTNIKEVYTNEEQNYPLNLFELFKESVNPESSYHYLGLLSLNTVIWNLDINIHLMNLLDFQNILLNIQNSKTQETENEETNVQLIDDYTLLRHRILSQTYFVPTKDEEEAKSTQSEEYDLPQFPPAVSEKENLSLAESEYGSVLENFLCDNQPTLLDSDWVEQLRESYAASPDPMKNTALIQLLEQMQKAIPTTEWGENFQWRESLSPNTDFWFTEEIHGIDLALCYAEQNDLMENTVETKEKLRAFINACYEFIQYKRPKKFDGFDWFLSTVFIICEGDVEKCKSFVALLIKFPVTKFLWSKLGEVVNEETKEECATQFAFMQFLESVVSNELPHVKFALKITSGMNWSLLCNSMMSQCFWNLLPWPQILHFLAICVLYSPDYIIYYCASLLFHCQRIIMQNVTSGKSWPDRTMLNDYQCHNYIRYMVILEKRYGNKILSKLSTKGFEHSE